jgi:HD-like signal output (HDOD) protein
MLAWLWRRFGGASDARTKGTPGLPARDGGRAGAAKAVTLDGRAQVANDVVAHGPGGAAAHGRQRVKEPYFALLSREAGVLEPLTLAQEQRTSEMVQAVLNYLRDHAIEPPVMPALASRMLTLLRADEVDVVALARLIEQDQATSARLLTISNSSLFTPTSEVGTVRDAVVFLGTEEVARIAIGLATRAMFEGPEQGARFGRLFQHAMTTAFAASQLATQRSRRHAEGAFLGGLFHDVGKAVALRAMVMSRTVDSAVDDHDPAVDAALHQLHGESSFALYDSWKLPRQLITICKSHHRLVAEAPPELHYVRVVSGLDALRRGCPLEKHEALPDIEESAAALRMTDAELRVANTETREFGERVARMFG